LIISVQRILQDLLKFAEENEGQKKRKYNVPILMLGSTIFLALIFKKVIA